MDTISDPTHYPSWLLDIGDTQKITKGAKHGLSNMRIENVSSASMELQKPASTACNSCGLKAGLSGSANLAYLQWKVVEMDVSST